MTPLTRARAAIGTRFRLHGRNVSEGLDCVGLAALAYGAGVPSGYALRSRDIGAVRRAVGAAGLPDASVARPGDLVLFEAGPGQLHLAIDCGDGVIHADAALRRVVERPGAAPWPELARWRAED
ncbi:peptidoglycan endopeptidase [Sphingomonas sp.]|uniref:peptidoglycan endopeptidase n=1 Tax=Sphingomonas sp. TaxID=28214 RepID=UPI001ED3A22C|nr:peptidoglycan endopeptidase [Sphingomonas sp.]MBX3593717.1 peptidoglycan endopeptidase [Sphingomonas sp.]